ncbi:MAG: hypothetical protein WBP22_05895 [Candidatus Saccharimonas sp.]
MKSQENTDYSERLHYINTNGVDSPFNSGFLCSDEQEDELFTPVFLPPLETEYSLHPNAAGHSAFKSLLESRIG